MPPGPCRRTTKYSRESTTRTNGGGHPSGAHLAQRPLEHRQLVTGVVGQQLHPPAGRRPAHPDGEARAPARLGGAHRLRSMVRPSASGSSTVSQRGSAASGGVQRHEGAVVVALRVEHPARAQGVVQQHDPVRPSSGGAAPRRRRRSRSCRRRRTPGRRSRRPAAARSSGSASPSRSSIRSASPARSQYRRATVVHSSLRSRHSSEPSSGSPRAMQSAENPVNVPISIARRAPRAPGEQLHERALLGRDLEGGRRLAALGHRRGLGEQVGGDLVGRLGGGADVVGEFRREEERPGRHGAWGSRNAGVIASDHGRCSRHRCRSGPEVPRADHAGAARRGGRAGPARRVAGRRAGRRRPAGQRLGRRPGGPRRRRRPGRAASRRS